MRGRATTRKVQCVVEPLQERKVLHGSAATRNYPKNKEHEEARQIS